MVPLDGHRRFTISCLGQGFQYGVKYAPQLCCTSPSTLVVLYLTEGPGTFTPYGYNVSTSSIITGTRALRPVYIERQRQRCNNAVLKLEILLSLKTRESLYRGHHTRGTPIY